MHSKINPSLLGQGGKCVRAPVHVFRGIGPFDPLTPPAALDYLGFSDAGGSFANLDLAAPGDGSTVTDDSDTPTTYPLTARIDSLSEGTRPQAYRVHLAVADLQAYYLAQAFAYGDLLNAGTSDIIIISASVHAFVVSTTPGSTISFAVAVGGTYAVAKDGGGVVTVDDSAAGFRIEWQGGNTSSFAAGTAGTHTCDLIQTAGGLFGAGLVLIDGVDQGAGFTTWNAMPFNHVDFHLRRLFTLQTSVKPFTCTMTPPASVGAVLFQKYAPA